MAVYSLVVLLSQLESISYSVSHLTVTSLSAHRFLRMQVRWSGTPISLRIFHSVCCDPHIQRLSRSQWSRSGYSSGIPLLFPCSSECDTIWSLVPLSLWNLVCTSWNYKFKSSKAIWPSNPTSGHTHQGNQIWKRHVHPNVHCSTVYHSQDMEAT